MNLKDGDVVSLVDLTNRTCYTRVPKKFRHKTLSNEKTNASITLDKLYEYDLKESIIPDLRERIIKILDDYGIYIGSSRAENFIESTIGDKDIIDDKETFIISTRDNFVITDINWIDEKDSFYSQFGHYDKISGMRNNYNTTGDYLVIMKQLESDGSFNEDNIQISMFYKEIINDIKVIKSMTRKYI